MKAAAFFDLDGTLLPPPSLERRFLRYLWWRGEMGVANWLRWSARVLLRLPFGLRHATEANKTYYAGVRCIAAEQWTARSTGFQPVRHTFAEGVERVRWHAAQGHIVFLVTGAIEPLAHWFARACLPPGVRVVATRLEALDGQWTGRLDGPHMAGRAKALAAIELAARAGIDLQQSYAYADRASDRWLLAAVGHPLAVNPSRALRIHARRRGWTMEQWRSPLGLTRDANRSAPAPLAPGVAERPEVRS